MTFSTSGIITQSAVSKGLDGTAMGITSEQKKMLNESGFEPGSKEYKQMEAQMKMTNLSEAITWLSTAIKKGGSNSETIGRNIG